MKPPVAARIPKTTVLHGETLVDAYFWLREKENPAVRAYLEAENAYADAETSHLDALSASLYDEMLARIQEDDTTAPYRFRGYEHWMETVKGRQYPIHHRRRLGGGGGADDARRQRSRPWAVVHVTRRLRDERRWRAPRVFDRRHRFPAIPTSREEPCDRRVVESHFREDDLRDLGRGFEDDLLHRGGPREARGAAVPGAGLQRRRSGAHLRRGRRTIQSGDLPVEERRVSPSWSRRRTPPPSSTSSRRGRPRRRSA